MLRNSVIRNPGFSRRPDTEQVAPDGKLGAFPAVEEHFRERAQTRSLASGACHGVRYRVLGGRIHIPRQGGRDTLFRALRKIAKRDQIQFQTLAGTCLYEVESAEIVAPQDVAVLAPGEQPDGPSPCSQAVFWR